MNRILLVLTLLLAACSGSDDPINLTAAPSGYLVVTPSPLMLGPAQEGGEVRGVIEISNAGLNPLEIRSVELVEPSGDDGDVREFFLGDRFDRATLSSGDTREIEVVYRPADSTTDRASIVLEVVGDDSISGPYEISILTIPPGPALSASGTIEFLDVFPVRSGDEPPFVTAELRNAGSAPLVLEDFHLFGSDAFVVRTYDGNPDEGASEVDEWPEQLEHDESFWYRVYFAPTDRMPKEGTLQFRTNDPNHQVATVELVGETRRPCLEVFGPDRLEFPDAFSALGRSTNVSLRSCSSASDALISNLSLRGTGFQLEGDAAEEFAELGQLSLEPGETATVDVAFRPPVPGPFEATLEIESNDPSLPFVEIELFGERVEDLACPVAEPSAEPDLLPVGGRVQLDGSSSYDPDGAPIVRYEWTGGTSRFIPSADLPAPTSTALAPGLHQFDLTVWDSAGVSSCEPGSTFVTVYPLGDLVVQATWTTPGDPDSSDDDAPQLDLHMLERQSGSWGVPPAGVSSANPTAEWGDIGPTGDPTWATGVGESQHVVVNDPAKTEFGVGVHYLDDNDMGPSQVTLRVFYEGMMVFERKDQTLNASGEFWEVGTFDGRSGTWSLIDSVTAGLP